MTRDHGLQVDLLQHVAVEHDDRVLHGLRRELDGAAGTERLRFDRVGDLDAERVAVAEGLLDAPRLVVEAEDHFGDLRHLTQLIELIHQERAVEDRDDRFRAY